MLQVQESSPPDTGSKGLGDSGSTSLEGPSTVSSSVVNVVQHSLDDYPLPTVSSKSQWDRHPVGATTSHMAHLREHFCGIQLSEETTKLLGPWRSNSAQSYDLTVQEMGKLVF